MKPTLYKRLIEDIDSFMARDPAARSRWEVVLCYPGYHALMGYRVSSALWRLNWRLLARFLSNISKILSGIEIHPGATIGRRFFIDHGTGVVIGETSEIGDDVMLYQGVTLGGTSLEKGKRHPTLEDGVVVGSGAQVLGPLIVGAGARIGANAVVLKDVEKGATMVGIPAKMVMARPKEPAPDFPAYGVTSAELPDPIARSMDSMRVQINMLIERIEQLEAERDAAAEPTDTDHDATQETKFKSTGG
ncbi:MAG: serine O-acetyltransferase [Rhodospirillaceae bacterium]|jgi:serine O-acetyltransferase|nr:serine O-acetyltransferase [Rhodospirillaceae bacterium]MBT3883693.1 serine O-acetyltransferase [Rhodospirillaceae bacterium]MBT4119145.1 serine O-acetyltransferase [Rhodospirillaceae bacterium]MBT4674675.1 serine O-acetyltransferase [Rhodospirillaceae bacterium]MBT4718120.1 serine O-acetyltransferase [Rhodospirillaceae bacterium]